MAEEGKRRWHRFRIRRHVPVDDFKTREQRELEQAARDADKNDKGPLDDGGMKQGCYGCLGVMTLLFVIMIASILTTCIIPGDWSPIGR